jgi:TolB-like protein/Tfp pilus assembly protein PilF
MSFIAELKQRKVFRVATVYLVVAWVAIQAASIALPAFDAPAWVMRVVILLFALGFPVALMLAWALEWTSEGVKLDAGGAGSKYMVIVTAGLLLLAIAWYFLGQPGMRRIDHARTTTAAPAVAERSIAVLPFLNLSGDPKNEYFSDGLAETTLDMLAQVPDLKVIARTSSFAFKGKSQDMRKIGAALGAANLLEGSVQQAGDTLRITVQLIKAADGTHLWSHHYDRPMVDLFKIQDEIADQVVQELKIALPASQQQRLTQKRTENIEAYQEYLKGMALLPERKVADLHEAASHFERSITLDPGYARAYASASDAYNLLESYGGTLTSIERSRMTAYIDRALALAPDLGEAHLTRANSLQDKGDLPGAEREYRMGIALAPNNSNGYQWYAQLLGAGYGRLREGLAMAQRAAVLDPLSPTAQSDLIFAAAANGLFAQAERLLVKLHADHPNYASGYQTEAVVASWQGDLVRALRAMREQAKLDPGAFNLAGSRCGILQRFGALQEARNCLDLLAINAPDSPAIQTDRATLSALVGDWTGAQAQLSAVSVPAPEAKAALLRGAGRDAEALAIYRQIDPDLFREPASAIYPGRVAAATNIGIALLRTGARAQGESLLRSVLQARIDRRVMDLYLQQWSDVVIHAALGEHEQAITALKLGIAEGYFLDIAYLDVDPLLAELRSDPRYQQILAPARAKAAAQVEAARKAGLL